MATGDDPYDLQRFVDAQAAVYDRVIGELSAGRKRSHWIWFVFPQRIGLGRSPMSVRYAIRSDEEARAYLAHPVLGPRLQECTALVEQWRTRGRALEDILGEIDAMKYRSCMDLFAPLAGVR
jgi:uncharacterized protein (DUF1810 family)